MARIFIISNRVSVPTDQAAPHAGGLEVALRVELVGYGAGTRDPATHGPHAGRNRGRGQA